LCQPLFYMLYPMENPKRDEAMGRCMGRCMAGSTGRDVAALHRRIVVCCTVVHWGALLARLPVFVDVLSDLQLFFSLVAGCQPGSSHRLASGRVVQAGICTTHRFVSWGWRVEVEVCPSRCLLSEGLAASPDDSESYRSGNHHHVLGSQTKYYVMARRQ